MIDEGDIGTVNINVANLLANRIPGVSLGPGGWLNIRGSNSLNNNQLAIFDIDGQIFAPAINNGQVTQVPAIDVNNIKRIAVLNNLANTASYGSIGNGGVIVINTFSASSSNNNLLDRARLRNNIYKDNALTANEVDKNLPTYLLDYEASSSVNGAKSVYESNLKNYYNSPHFFIDSYAYFMNRGEEKFAADIVKKNLPLFERNAVYLKAMAYYADANNDMQKSKDFYEQVFILRPNYAQSYRDLAENYRDVKNYKKAAAMYARYNYLVEEGFLESDSLGLGSIMERDSENLLAIEGDKVVEGGKSKKRLAKYTEFDGTRLLFEWNDSEAEFELQFVNPEKHYYTWKHTTEANAERIMDEKLKGYSSEEFLVDGSLAGKWQVNVDYKGNKKLEPTYLKVTSYFNYGQSSQRKEVNVYRLSLKNVNQKLFEMVNAGRISAN